jgi:manganese transport protein
MPHAVYVHSSLAARAAGRTQPHAVLEISPVARDRARLRGHRVDVVTALTLAGAVNVAMLVTAARLLPGLGPLADLGQAHAALAAAAGGGAALVFALALLASGLSSASVGTCAGEVVMEGLLGRRVPVWARRAVTMIPALVVLGAGANTGTALLLSQVVLSLGLPFTLVPLVLLTRSRAVMGALVNRAATTAAAVTVTVAVTALNVVLLAQVVRW